jgi:hypothetical protein
MPPELFAPAGTFGLPDDELQPAIHRRTRHGRRNDRRELEGCVTGSFYLWPRPDLKVRPSI